jgi:hypothetical protein
MNIPVTEYDLLWVCFAAGFYVGWLLFSPLDVG